jgi:hypothetical protein
MGILHPIMLMDTMRTWICGRKYLILPTQNSLTKFKKEEFVGKQWFTLPIHKIYTLHHSNHLNSIRNKSSTAGANTNRLLVKLAILGSKSVQSELLGNLIRSTWHLLETVSMWIRNSRQQNLKSRTYNLF